MTSAEKAERGIESLPGSLYAAIGIAENSEPLRMALGEHVFTKFIENKKIEWDQYRTQVTGYEIRRYLPIL